VEWPNETVSTCTKQLVLMIAIGAGLTQWLYDIKWNDIMKLAAFCQFILMTRNSGWLGSMAV
jgi:hypothetical protein